jgi:hypothetical protein
MLKTPIVHVVCLVATTAIAPSCARPVLKSPGEAPRASASAPLEELWRSPTDLDRRDLFWGPGQQSHRPVDRGRVHGDEARRDRLQRRL